MLCSTGCTIDVRGLLWPRVGVLQLCNGSSESFVVEVRTCEVRRALKGLFGFRVYIGFRVCRQCARGGCASLEMGAHPLIARLRQHVVPPRGGLSCSLLPFAVRHINNHIAQLSTAEMDWRRVVGPCGLCRPLDENQTKNTSMVVGFGSLFAA